MKTLYIDIETYSDVNLLDSGMHRYAEGKDFALLLFAYSVDGGEVHVVDVANGEGIPENIVNAIFDDTVIKVAHNASFERVCLSRWFARAISPASWRCTLAQCARMGVPIALGDTANALGLEERKDENGKRLIGIFCVPQKPTKSNGMRTRITSSEAPMMWEQFKSYCAQDVRTEIAIDRASVLGKAVDPWELRVQALSERINDRGILVDRAFAEQAVRIDGDVRERLNNEAKRITGLDNPMSPQQLMNWLASRGIKTYTVNATRVEEIRQRTRDIDVLRVLSIRQQLAKISTSKYNTMLAVMGYDDRARGLFMYYGTHTGRWSGRLVQMHNLPKSGDIDLSAARNAILSGDADTLDLEYGNVTDVLSQLIRTAFVAPRGKIFVVLDYSAIEARVLAWLADDEKRLSVFRAHGKIYEATASQLYGVSIDEVTDKQRQHGKVAELSLGYQGGVNALIAMGGNKIGLTNEQLGTTVDEWRKANPKITQLWSDVEKAVIYCVKYNTTTTICKGLTAEMYSDALYISLPTGRYIAYPGISLDKGKISYIDDHKRTCVHLYGGKIVENIVQAIARDCLADAMLRIDDAGYKIVAHVHDEVIVEIDAEDTQAPDIIKSIFIQAPEWAKDLPLRGEGFTSQYYRK